MTLKQRLEEASLGRGDFVIGAANAFKLLDLLKAAKEFHTWTGVGESCDDDSFYSCRDALLNAIHAIESPPERVAGRPERMPPGSQGGGHERNRSS